MTKATRATVKAFIRKNPDTLLIYIKRRFDGMIDGCADTGDTGFSPALRTSDWIENTLGIQGAWFVGSSRDYITRFDKDGIEGFEISNCCGSFSIGVFKNVK